MSGRPPELQSRVEGVAATANSIGTTPGAEAGAAASWLDQLPGGVFQLHRDVEGRWTFPFANAETLRLLGMSASGLRRDARAVRAVLHPVDLAELKSQLDHSRETGTAWKARARVLRPGGTMRWVEVSAAPESQVDASTVWRGFLMDVHYEHDVQGAARELHGRHVRALQATGVGLVEFDPGDQRLRLDRLARQQHGLDASQAELPLSHWLELWHPEDRALAQAAWVIPETAASTPVPSQNLVLRLQALHDTSPRSLQWRVQHTVNANTDGASDARTAVMPSRVLGTCQDVTAQQQQTLALSQQRAAELAEHSRNEFLSRISHELRTPLNGVLGYAQLMALDREHPLPRTQSQRLAVLQESSARLLSLIDQLLEVRGIDQGEVTLNPEVVDLHPLVARCVQAALPLAQAHGVDVEVAMADDRQNKLPAHVRADPAALEQVIGALLSNAIKYNRPQGRVRIRFVCAEMGTVLIDDTGPGLTPAQLAKLFEPLNRLGAERGTIPGHGLGLITARKLTQAMGGKLKAWSQLGTGSRFAVSLALAKEERPVGAPESDFSGLVPSQWEGGAQRIVLYVEDDEVNTTLMEQVFLMQPEWRLITASTGEEGVVAAQTHLPELALIDIGLPGISGIEVMRQLSGDLRTQHIHCVALSADTSHDAVQRAVRAGFQDYWTKPFDILSMVNRLKALLV